MELVKIPTKKVSELVAEQIEAWIKTGKVVPGDKLPSVRELCEQLEVGRSAVRDAITTLKGKGLVDVRQGEGAFVCQQQTQKIFADLILLNSQDVQELYTVRKMLEIGAAEKAAVHRNRENLHQLEKALLELQGAEQSEQWSADFDFHLAIAQATQNKVIMQLMEALASIMEKALKDVHKLIAASPLVSEAIEVQHTDIFMAIKEASTERARETMLTHLTYVEGLLLKSLEREV